MPVMDGYQFCEKTIKYYNDQIKFFDSDKVDYQPTQKPYLVACTAMVNQEIENKAISIGYDLVIEQPLSLATLQEQIIPVILDSKEYLKNSNEMEKLSSQFNESE